MIVRRSIYYFLPYFFISIGVFGFLHQGFYVFAGAASILVLHPILDSLVSVRMSAKMASVSLDSKYSIGYRIVLYLMLPALLFLLFLSWKSLGAATSEIEIFGILLSSGLLLGTFGITTAHELVHRKNSFEEGLGLALLAMVNFTHFAIFHVKGHHKNVGTKADPATAYRGEGVYSYWLRAIPGEISEAFHIENARLLKKFDAKASRLRLLLHNRVLQFFLLSVFLFFVISYFFGSKIAVAWILQSLISILLLTTIDYIEHYGLERVEVKPGTYEPVRPWHSWDSLHLLTNLSLCNLGMHSDHHLKVQKPFNELDGVEGALVMPHGYSVMFLMALVPPLYRRKMELLLDARKLN